MPRALLDMATQQGGLIQRSQILGMLTRGKTATVARRAPRVARGLYLVTSPEREIGELEAHAALLLCGGESRLWRWSAAAVEGWVRAPSVHEVLVSHVKQVRHSAGMAVRRSNPALRRAGSPSGLRRTWPEDTALDCLATLDGDEVAHLLLRLLHERHVRPAQLRRALDRRQRLRNMHEITELIGEAERGSESGLEFVALRNIFRRHQLPDPARQPQTAGGRSDFRLEKMIIELDGRRYHGDVASRFRDAAKDNANVLSGLPTLRYGYEDATRRPCLCVRQVVELGGLLGMTLRASPCPRCRPPRRTR